MKLLGSLVLLGAALPETCCRQRVIAQALILPASSFSLFFPRSASAQKHAPDLPKPTSGYKTLPARQGWPKQSPCMNLRRQAAD